LSFGDVSTLWREGERRLAEVEAPRERAALERVIDAIVDELRRRLGGPFTVEELIRLYMRDGTDWCFEVATRVAPNEPAAWDLTTVSGAGFARYLRQASDFGGGTRIVRQD
jgi:hypothetical protein